MLEVRIKKTQGDFVVDAAFKLNGTGITALFGKSGAGKTSVINMVAGLSRPDEGRIAVNGTVYYDSNQGINVRTEKRRFGYIFQDGRLFPHLSVRSNLMYGMKLIPSSERFLGFDQVVDVLGIDRLLNRRPANLSGGEKQRVAIGRALLTSPHLVLMDEPLASLDNERKNELLPFIAMMQKEFSIPILYVTHSVQEIINLAHNVVIIEYGRIIASGGVQELLHRLSAPHCREIKSYKLLG